jgi:hypothetical protein
MHRVRFPTESGKRAASSRPGSRAFAVCLALLLLSGCVVSPRGLSLASSQTGRCLSLSLVNSSYRDGDPVEHWNCSHYQMGLKGSWELAQSGTDYRLISLHSGKCLEMNGMENGDAAHQAQCSGAASQRWTVQTASGAPTTLQSVNSGKCLQAKVGAQDGDPIYQWDCNGKQEQLWSLNYLPDAPYPPRDTGPGQLCNACDTANPSCAPGSMCLSLTTHQSLCVSKCSAGATCPAGYACTNGLCVPAAGPNKNSCP